MIEQINQEMRNAEMKGILALTVQRVYQYVGSCDTIRSNLIFMPNVYNLAHGHEPLQCIELNRNLHAPVLQR